MAFYDTTWYCSSVGYAAVTARPQNTAVAAGVVRKQFTAPAVGSERAFVCIVAGTTANVTDATWVTTRGAKTTDGTVTWQECTGASAVNGDLTNTASWTTAKATGTPTLGAIIKRNNGASYQICSTAGTMGASEPSFSDTAGVTTNDGTSVWTSLGVVGNFSGGGGPHARLGNVYGTNWAAAGNTVYIADNHAETQSTAPTIAVTSGSALVNKILCHNHSGSYPPAAGDLTTGATITTTGNSSIVFSGGGPIYVYGVTFQSGSGASGAAHITFGTSTFGIILDNCSAQLLTTGTTSRIFLGNAAAPTYLVFKNTTVKFGATAQAFDVAGICNFVWRDTASALAAGSSVPSSLFSWNLVSTTCNFIVEGVDISAISGNLINFTNNLQGSWTFQDCKIHASATVSGNPAYGSATIQLIRCDSGATAYKSTRWAAEATETTETSITRVGGAADPTGQAQSRKIVTTANAQWLRPFQAEPYAIWNPTTGANVTVTVYGTINAGAVPNNDDVWLEIEYLGDSASPLGEVATTTKSSLLASNAAVASDGSSWNGGGSGAGWSPFKLTTTLSSPQPAMAGYIEARVRAAKASTTYYIDPKIELT